MPHDRNLILQTDDFYDFIRKQTLLRAFQDFAVRSTATGTFPANPSVPVKTLLALFPDFELVLSRWTRAEDHILRNADCILVLTFDRGLHLLVESRSFDAREIRDGLLKRLEPFRRGDEDEEDGVWVDFSYMGKRSVERTTQFLRAPAWETVRANYPAPVLASLDRLFTLESPWERGRLLIWHGPPGTGKTWAIRALMMQWRKTFDFMVVLDPERLTVDPQYYYEVASNSLDNYRRRIRRPSPEMLGLDDPLADEDDEDPPARRRRKLFILEDSADLILKESRSEHYDKIGKLLNMTDGLFGQGREDLFLLTFNEDVEAIDPAFLRPGRCVANVAFPKFVPSEAAAWLEAHGTETPDVDEDASLAELYERVHRGKGAEFVVQGGRHEAKGFGAGRVRREGE